MNHTKLIKATAVVALQLSTTTTSGISFRDEANAKDTAEFCIFFQVFGIQIIHLRKFENFEVIAIFKKTKRTSKVCLNTSYIEASKIG